MSNMQWDIRTLVQHFKDGNVETMACKVFEDVTYYLQKHAHSLVPNVNTLQISKDLVTFGVDKKRKTKCYVYGIKSPSRFQLYTLLCTGNVLA